MIRTQEATGKTVDEARAKACALLGVQADDLNVSYEVLEMPQKTGFLGLKTTPAKVRVSVEEPDAPAAPVVEEKVEPEVKPVVEEAPAEEPKAEETAAAPVAENLDRLRIRLAESSFPHEIGLFLGYPLADVQGFIAHCGRNYRLCGCWKVYGDPCFAQRCFAKYKKCRDVYLKCYEQGQLLSRLTVVR